LLSLLLLLLLTAAAAAADRKRDIRTARVRLRFSLFTVCWTVSVRLDFPPVYADPHPVDDPQQLS